MQHINNFTLQIYKNNILLTLFMTLHHLLLSVMISVKFFASTYPFLEFGIQLFPYESCITLQMQFLLFLSSLSLKTKFYLLVPKYCSCFLSKPELKNA